MSKRMLVFSVFITSLTAAAQNDDYEYAGDDGQQRFTQAPPSDAYGNAQLPQSEPGPTVKSVDQFTQPLSPYGSWVSEDGVNAFQPSTRVVGADFTPYASQGQWVATTAGWEFQSSLPFSWATYHYGRWYQSPRYGWVWVPDTQWAPSWVEWRYGGGYAGWAPLAPRHVSVSYQPRWFFVESCNLRNNDVYRYSVARNRAWGITTSVGLRGGFHVGPSYNDWSARFGQRFSAPRVTARYQQPARFPPPPPMYSPPRGGFHAAPPPPRSNGGGFNGGNHGGFGNHGNDRGGDRGGGNRGGGNRGGGNHGGRHR